MTFDEPAVRFALVSDPMVSAIRKTIIGIRQ